MLTSSRHVAECTPLVTGTMRALQTAVAQARALVFDMGSTTPWLDGQFQDLRYVITDRLVNGSPVWAADGGEWFMYRSGTGTMYVSDENNCAAGRRTGWIFNTVQNPDVQAPSQLLSNEWRSVRGATLGAQYTSALKYDSTDGVRAIWVDVPDMRVTAVHGLDDAEPAMAAALRHLAALPGDE